VITVPHSNFYDPCTWKRVRTRRGKKASFTCPNGHTKSLSDYLILANGYVLPAYFCPDPCGFWKFIRLDGWSLS